jgi:hypothetical protein
MRSMANSTAPTPTSGTRATAREAWRPRSPTGPESALSRPVDASLSGQRRPPDWLEEKHSLPRRGGTARFSCRPGIADYETRSLYASSRPERRAAHPSSLARRPRLDRTMWPLPPTLTRSPRSGSRCGTDDDFSITTSLPSKPSEDVVSPTGAMVRLYWFERGTYQPSGRAPAHRGCRPRMTTSFARRTAGKVTALGGDFHGARRRRHGSITGRRQGSQSETQRKRGDWRPHDLSAGWGQILWNGRSPNCSDHS